MLTIMFALSMLQVARERTVDGDTADAALVFAALQGRRSVAFRCAGPRRQPVPNARFIAEALAQVF